MDNLTNKFRGLSIPDNTTNRNSSSSTSAHSHRRYKIFIIFFVFFNKRCDFNCAFALGFVAVGAEAGDWMRETAVGGREAVAAAEVVELLEMIKLTV